MFIGVIGGISDALVAIYPSSHRLRCGRDLPGHLSFSRRGFTGQWKMNEADSNRLAQIRVQQLKWEATRPDLRPEEWDTAFLLRLLDEALKTRAQ